MSITDKEVLDALKTVSEYCHEHTGCFNCVLHEHGEICDLKKPNELLDRTYVNVQNRFKN